LSVPANKRELSHIQFLFELYQFNVKLAEICENSPKKYRANYADHIIKTGLKALQLAQYGNSIYLSKATTEDAFNEREMSFKKAESLVDNIATTSQIYLELVRKCGVPNEKIAKRQEYIGAKANEIISLLQGVQKSDRERYKKYKS
jgi:hypothetical protein